MDRGAREFDLLPELGELASQLAHPVHDRLAAGPKPAACEADRVTQLTEGPVVVEGFGRARLPDCPERSVEVPELLEQADVGPLVRPWLDVVDELLRLSPPVSGPQEVAAGSRNRPRDAGLCALEPLPQAPQPRYPAASGPGPVDPQDNRGLSVDPHVEVERTADVCPSGPSRHAGDQRRDGRVIWAGPRSEPARQGGARGRSFASGHGNGPPAHPRRALPASMARSCRDATGTRWPEGRTAPHRARQTAGAGRARRAR